MVPTLVWRIPSLCAIFGSHTFKGNQNGMIELYSTYTSTYICFFSMQYTVVGVRGFMEPALNHVEGEFGLQEDLVPAQVQPVMGNLVQDLLPR